MCVCVCVFLFFMLVLSGYFCMTCRDRLLSCVLKIKLSGDSSESDIFHPIFSLCVQGNGYEASHKLAT